MSVHYCGTTESGHARPVFELTQPELPPQHRAFKQNFTLGTVLGLVALGGFTLFVIGLLVLAAVFL